MKPLTPTTPHVIIMLGIPGAGKTYFATHFSETFTAPFVHHDYILDTVKDETIAGAMTNHLLLEILKTKRTFVFEGPTHLKSFREALIETIGKAGYTPLLVWVQTDPAEAKRRATKKGGRYSVGEFTELVRSFEIPGPKEKLKPVVISGRHTHAQQIRSVLKSISEQRPAVPARPATRLTIERNFRNR